MTNQPPKTTAEERFWRHNTAPEASDVLPPPPYQVTDVYMSFIGVRYDETAVRQLLPPELEPVETHTGTICVYSVGAGWGLAPFDACFASVEVKGFDAPDGSPGFYLATGYYSDRGYKMMSGSYNQHALKGRSRHFYDGDVAVGLGGPDGADVLTIKSRPAAEKLRAVGVRHYLGKRPGGDTNMFPIAFAGPMSAAEPISVEISDAAGERLKLARPVELLYAAECTDFSLTFGPPRPTTDPPAELADELTRASLLSVFTGIGRAAVLVGAEGEVVVMNPNAESLLGDGISVYQGRLRASRPPDQAALDRIVAAAVERGTGQFDLEPIALDREASGPLIAQAMPMDPSVAGKPSALILLTDPARENASDIAPALQLLGLTPTEAKIAILVGSGLAPREAAEKLNNSQGTVRTALNHIYSKLSIGRQSELARIVTRLESIGV